MHLVFLNQYYPPDAAPTGVMLEAVVEELARQGHAVTVICAAGGYAGGAANVELRTSNMEHRREELAISDSQPSTPNSQPLLPQPSTLNPQLLPNQPSTINSQPLLSQPSTLNSQLLPTILRLPASKFGRGTMVGKLMDYASYYVGVAWTLTTLRARPDRIVALTTPPYLSVLARLVSKFRRADHAHWVMDLYPDVMAAHGMLGEASPGYRILAGLARWGFGGRRCAAVLTLGPDMAERVGRHLKELTAEAQRPRRVAEVTRPANSDSQLSTLNSQLSSVHWVPLWSGERGNIEPRTSEVEFRKEENGSEASAAGEVGGGGGPTFPSVSQPSTLNYQLSSSESFPSTSALGGEVGRPGGAALSSVSQLSTLNSQLSSAESSPGTSALGGKVGRPSGPALPSVSQPSTLNSQLSSSESSPGTSALGGEVGEPSSPALPSNNQPSTINHQLSSPLRARRGWGRDELIVMYSGNMGLGHRFGEILEAVERGGGGYRTPNVERQTPNIEPRRDDNGRGGSAGGEVGGEVGGPGGPALPSNSQPSTLTSQLSSSESSPGTSARGGQVGRPGGPALPTSNNQPSTLNHQPPSSSPRFVFYGRGKRRGEVEAFLEKHPGCALELHDYAPAEELAAHLQSADVHLASLDPAWTGTMVPSKLQGIFAAGRPVIFIGSAESSIGQWVVESGGGWVVAAGDVEGLMKAFAEARDPAIRLARGRAAQEFAKTHFDPRTNVARVAGILGGRAG